MVMMHERPKPGAPDEVGPDQQFDQHDAQPGVVFCADDPLPRRFPEMDDDEAASSRARAARVAAIMAVGEAAR